MSNFNQYHKSVAGSVKNFKTGNDDSIPHSPGYLLKNQTSKENIISRKPGYLKNEIYNTYLFPTILRGKELTDKNNYRPDTGTFSGQPGVLYKFGRNYKK